MPRLANHLRLPATRRFQSALVSGVDRTIPQVQRAFDSLDSYDEDNIAGFAARAASSLSAVKSFSIRQAVGYYTILAGVRAPQILAHEVATAANTRAPFISVWQALASGHKFEDAVLIGRARVEAMVSDFAHSSARQTGDVFVDKAHLSVRGWERIPDAGACAWCEEVAGEIYASAESADFGHDRCACSAAPAF